MRDKRKTRHARRMRAWRNARLLRELRKRWLGRLLLWLYNRRVQRELYGELAAREGNA